MSNRAWRFILSLALAVSLVALPSLISKGYLPSLPEGHAVAPPVQPWTPAGPASNNLEINIFAGLPAECLALFAAPPLIDALDVPACVPNPCGGPNYFLTASGYCYTIYWQGVINDGFGAPGTFNFFTALKS